MQVYNNSDFLRSWQLSRWSSSQQRERDKRKREKEKDRRKKKKEGESPRKLVDPRYEQMRKKRLPLSQVNLNRSNCHVGYRTKANPVTFNEERKKKRKNRLKKNI